MFDAAVYFKTDKGRDEISRRNHHLSARLRAALILVDGKANGASLRRMLSPLGQVDELMQQLIDAGFIESDFDIPSAGVIQQTFAALIPVR